MVDNNSTSLQLEKNKDKIPLPTSENKDIHNRIIQIDVLDSFLHEHMYTVAVIVESDTSPIPITLLIADPLKNP